MLGKSLGPYHIIEPLGAGGMGEVYRARDAALNREQQAELLDSTVDTGAPWPGWRTPSLSDGAEFPASSFTTIA
jgi:serine/threonine protein kinase